MTTFTRSKKPTAFTLIELLVVMGIIALLAGIIIPMAGTATANAKLKRAAAEMNQLGTAIDRYKAAKGFYPPDNPANSGLPSLFYELSGTYLVDGIFYRINAGENIKQADVATVFLTGGFMNSSPLSGLTNQVEISQAEARNFWPSIPPSTYASFLTNNIQIWLLGMNVDGPNDLPVTNASGSILQWNPWHYNSSNPTNNPNSYDLWIDILTKNKTNRICNWSTEPIPL